MNVRMWLVLGCVAALAGCASVRQAEPQMSEVTGEQCRDFEVTIRVPDASLPGARLSARGGPEITQGCAPIFRRLADPGAAPGTLWVVFGELDAAECDPAVTPFMDKAGRQPVCRFAIQDDSSVMARSVEDEVCLDRPGCKYWIEHRPPSGPHRYPPLDPHIIIVM